MSSKGSETARQEVVEKKYQPEEFVFDPPTVAKMGTAHARKALTGPKGIYLPIPGIGKPDATGWDPYIGALMAGQVCMVFAQTSNFKTGFMEICALDAAQQLEAQGRYDECVLYIQLEESIEEKAIFMLARSAGMPVEQLAQGNVKDWGVIDAAEMRVGNIPIYRLGTSLERAEMLPYLYLSNIIGALQKMTNGSLTPKPIKPAIIFLDYLQALPLDKEVKSGPIQDQRRLQIMSDVDRIYVGSKYFACPWVVGVQAKPKLDSAAADFQMPGLFDGQESSWISQRADRILALWMPKMTHTIGTVITHKQQRYTVVEDMVWLKVLKQRNMGLKSGRSWPLRINFDQRPGVDPLTVMELEQVPSQRVTSFGGRNIAGNDNEED